MLANLWFILRVGDVFSVSSRRGTRKDRSLENSGCARASVKSAEVVLGRCGHGSCRVNYLLLEVRGLSASNADTTSLLVFAVGVLRNVQGPIAVAKPLDGGYWWVLVSGSWQRDLWGR